MVELFQFHALAISRDIVNTSQVENENASTMSPSPRELLKKGHDVPASKEPSCAACGKNGPFSVRQLKRLTQGNEARCSKCIQENISIPARDDRTTDVVIIAKDNATATSQTQAVVVATELEVPGVLGKGDPGPASASSKRKRIYFSDSGSASEETDESSSSSSSSHSKSSETLTASLARNAATATATSPDNEEMDVSLDAIKRKILGRTLQTNDEASEDNDSPSNNDELGSVTAEHEHLRKDLGCAICHELFHQPVSLHCGHSFCGECLRWWFTHSRPQPTTTGAAASASTVDRYGKCPTCRRALTCDGASLGVNTALRACIMALFGKEARERVAIDQRAKLKATAGENGGVHSRGYEPIEKLTDVAWRKVRKGGLAARRSIVLDADDQRMQLALALYGDEPIEFIEAGRGTNAEVQLTLCLLIMEEDEASDSGGFPLIVRGADDHTLVVTEDRFQYSSIEVSARIGGSPPISDVPIARPGLRDGLVRFQINLGTPALKNVEVLYFRDEETGAELELRLPTITRRSLKYSSANPKMGSENSEVDEQERKFMVKNEDRCGRNNDLDQDEDDSFESRSGGEEGDCENDFVSDSELLQDEDYSSDEDEEQPIEDLCFVCEVGGELLVCDGGEHLDGCGHNFHVECVGRNAVPPGDWVCETCANAAEIVVGLEGFEFPPNKVDSHGKPAMDRDKSDDESRSHDEGDSDTDAKTGDAKHRALDFDGEKSDEPPIIPPSRQGNATRKARRKAIIWDSDDD